MVAARHATPWAAPVRAEDQGEPGRRRRRRKDEEEAEKEPWGAGWSSHQKSCCSDRVYKRLPIVVPTHATESKEQPLALLRQAAKKIMARPHAEARNGARNTRLWTRLSGQEKECG
ncbi:unnamed protein product [Prorocentrum cordatum]|uniref:Uncharacterized protein n=1 Tax=Prorocentrum cordatum TaxID=2364126 RepID=A0ABN9U5G5_9DINO|nr:unnamed protein product [Polarella glacialis]